MMRLGWLLVVVACSKAEPPSATPDDKPGLSPRAPQINVALAGVTLAEDCPDGVPTKPLAPPATASAGSAATAASEPAAAMPKLAAGACAPGVHCGGPPQPACEQTAMQLAVQVPAGASATKIQIKQVELLDSGKVVGVLTARAPSKWDGKGAYVTWDEAVAAAQADLAVSYKLSAPDWAKLTNGRWNAASKKFALRVTVTISDKDRTIEKQSIVPAMPEPAVAT